MKKLKFIKGYAVWYWSDSKRWYFDIVDRSRSVYEKCSCSKKIAPTEEELFTIIINYHPLFK